MRTLRQILERKERRGEHCTQLESARIKQLLKRINRCFPNEWDEADEEIVRAERELRFMGESLTNVKGKV